MYNIESPMYVYSVELPPARHVMYSGCEPQELFVVIYIWFLFLAVCLGGGLLGSILLVGIILYTYMGGGGDIATSLSGQLAWYVRNCMPVDRNSSSSFFYNSPRL